uniref:protein-tyrosine-phosphatase n=1 Tax=Maylandia zebra TaxID=106582 RepID=A0A3P9DD77_9CICH
MIIIIISNKRHSLRRSNSNGLSISTLKCKQIYDCAFMHVNVCGSMQELSEVGKDLPTRAGDSEVNREKNRYPFILPYDHCRVRLSVQNSYPHTDYINANFVPGGGSERDFICTQGPLPNTIADFWRMVWEQNVRIVVMVTALKHKDIVRDTYSFLTRKQGPDYFITTINLRHVSERHRIITHYYYPSWPDRGVPKSPSTLCVFTEHVRQHLETIPRMGPAVVHCSLCSVWGQFEIQALIL